MYARDQANPQAADPASSRTDPMIGKVIDDFEIVREIGRGGMGVVYEAIQRSLQRTVAVKVLTAPIGMSRSAVQRFQREARAAAKLHHPNIVRIYAQGHAHDVYYYAMELIDGRSIHQIISAARGTTSSSDFDATETRVLDTDQLELNDSSTGTTPPSSGGSDTLLIERPTDSSGSVSAPLTASAAEDYDNIARLMASVADALDYAHQAGIIHRDIKPHNLILGNDDRLCISDFGLARVREQPGVTVTGEQLGSPLYMSPEQISGDPGDVDQRTDIYSLGVTLYEWLALRPPFVGQRRDQVVQRILTDDPLPPRAYNPSIPVDLETICLKAMERERGRRYQTAGQVAADLRAYLERSGIRARRVGPVRRWGRLLYRKRVAALAGLVVILGAAFAGLVWDSRRPAETAKPLTPTTVDANGQPGATPAQPPPDLTPDGPDPGSPAAPPSPEPAAVPAEQVDPFQQGQALAEQARTLLSTRDEAEVQAFDRLVATRLGNTLKSEHWAAQTAQLFGGGGAARSEADKLYFEAVLPEDDDKVLELVDRALAEDSDHYPARHLRGVVHLRQFRFKELLVDAKELVRIMGGSPQSHLMLGIALLMLDQPDAAIEAFDKTGELLRDGGLEATAWLHTLRGLAYARTEGLQLRAMGAYNQALEIDPDHAVARLARAEMLTAIQDYEAAMHDAERVIEKLPDLPEGYALRGECNDRLGRYEQALADYSQAIDLGGDRMKLYLAWTTAALNLERLKAEEEATAESSALSAAAAEREGADDLIDLTDENAPPGPSDNLPWGPLRIP